MKGLGDLNVDEPVVPAQRDRIVQAGTAISKALLQEIVVQEEHERLEWAPGENLSLSASTTIDLICNAGVESKVGFPV